MPNIPDLDHIVIATRDLAGARRQYERLGFAVTPRGAHTILGSSNHCMMFADGNYLELLAMDEPGRRPFFDAFLVRREGPAAVAFKTHSAEATRAAWQAAGLAAGPLVAFGRPVDLPCGPGEARFITAEIDPSQTPEGRIFVCQHLTPEAVWLPEYLHHPNQIRAITALTVVTAEPARAADIYARTLGRKAQPKGDGFALALGTTTLRAITPGEAIRRFPADPLLGLPPPYFAAIELRSADPGATGAILRGNGVPVRRSGDGRLTVPSDAAIGAILEVV